MKIACTNLMLEGRNYTEQAQLLKQSGFDGISVFEDISRWDDRRFRELQELEKNTGIEVCEFCFFGEDYGKLMDGSRETRSRSRRLYEEAIAVCNELGAVTELEYEYRIQTEMPLFFPYQKLGEGEKELFLETLDSLADQVKGKARLLIEPVNRYESRCLNTVESCAEMVILCGKKQVGILADVFHMSMEEVDMGKAVETYGSMIYHVHLGDNNRLLPGKGSISWGALLNRIARYGNSPYMNLECAVQGNREKELAETALFLRNYI